NADGPTGADIGDMTPASVPPGAKPTAQAGAPSRRAPLRPDSPRRASAWREPGQAPWGETGQTPWGESGQPPRGGPAPNPRGETTEWSGPEPEWEPWPFPDEEPGEDEPAGPVFVDHSGRRRRMAI